MIFKIFIHFAAIVILKKKIAFIINPRSGTDRKKGILQLIDAEMDKSRYEVECIFTEYAAHATEIANRCAQANYYATVAVGGDGTVNEVARALIGSHTALGIIPKGSGNGLARSLNIPLDSRAAIRFLQATTPIYMDCGLLNNAPFFCACGSGFDSRVATQFSNAHFRGIAGYVYLSAIEYWRYRPASYRICTDSGYDQTVEAFFVAVCNANQFGSNFKIAPQASVNDGYLDVCVVKKFPLYSAPAMIWSTFKGETPKNGYVEIIRCRQVSVSSTALTHYHFDGEARSTSEPIDLKVQIRHNALSVLYDNGSASI
ncbi:MAG: YegS/Rv2252/BmrU family lipid kinase [Sphingobacteriales bacterium]|nr:YegS/Rv2252/BmrU family lipid kinase [Sphingobacteriales bacterium]